MPSASNTSLRRSNSLTGKNTSPLISTSAGTAPVSVSGTAAMVRTFAVTTSPVVPSPRVRARSSLPSTYVSEIDSPSILGSHTTACLPASRATRSHHAVTSSIENALSRLIIRSRCRSDAKPVRPPALPTVWVGDSGSINSGNCASISRASRSKASYSPSEIVGASSP